MVPRRFDEIKKNNLRFGGGFVVTYKETAKSCKSLFVLDAANPEAETSIVFFYSSLPNAF